MPCASPTAAAPTGAGAALDAFLAEGPAWRHGLARGQRRPPRPRTCCGPRQVHHHAGPELRPGRDPLAILGRTLARRHLGLCAGRRLPRPHQGQAEAARRQVQDCAPRRRQGVRRHRAGDGEADGGEGRNWLAGQAHQSRLARSRLVAVSRLDLHRRRDSAGCAGGGSLRLLPALPRHLPDARLPRALPARCAPLHLLPHHRA